jgi:hypothetical protein
VGNVSEGQESGKDGIRIDLSGLAFLHLYQNWITGFLNDPFVSFCFGDCELSGFASRVISFTGNAAIFLCKNFKVSYCA